MARTRNASPWVVLVATGLSVFAVFLDTTILYVAFPSISATFHDVSPAGLSWVLNAYTITFAAVLIPAGRLADRFGRRKTFLSAVVLFTVASMLCGLAPSVPVLIAARLVQAVGAAAMVPASLALVLQSFSKAKMPVAVAIWGSLGGISGAAGPSLGALVVETLGWRWAFFINLPVGIISFFLGRRVLPEGREAARGKLPDPVSIVLLAGGLAVLSYGVVETETWGWLSTGLAATVAIAAVLITLFFLRCRAVSNPVLDLRLLQSKNFRWANLSMFIYSIGFSAMFLGNILFMTNVWGFTILQAGLGIAPGPLIVFMLSAQTGRLAARYGQRPLLILGGLVWGASGLWLLTQATTTADYVGVYLPAVCISAIGVALVIPQLSSAAVKDLPQDHYGSGSAVAQATRNLGTTLGVAVTIAIVAAAPTLSAFRSTWGVLIASGVCVTLFAIRLPRHIHQLDIEPALPSVSVPATD